jgi:hypothetical protein
MSKYGYCVNGGEDGIQVTTDELDKFGDVVGSEALDEFIPLPNVPSESQIIRIKECSCSEHEEIYWERENGRHGWCCSNCGIVVQWG